MESVNFHELGQFGSTPQGLAAFHGFIVALECSTQRAALNALKMAAQSRILCIGREKGPVVWFQHNTWDATRCYFLWFSQDRNSDGVFVQSWTGGLGDSLVGPTQADIPLGAYEAPKGQALGRFGTLIGRRTFKWMDIRDAVNHALRMVSAFVRDARAMTEKDSRKINP